MQNRISFESMWHMECDKSYREFEAAVTNRRLAGLSKLANMSLSVQLIYCQAS